MHHIALVFPTWCWCDLWCTNRKEWQHLKLKQASSFSRGALEHELHQEGLLSSCLGCLWVVGAGLGHSFWLLPVFDRDLQIMGSLGNSAGGFGKKGCKDRALTLLSQRLKASTKERASENGPSQSQGRPSQPEEASLAAPSDECAAAPSQKEAVPGTDGTPGPSGPDSCTASGLEGDDIREAIEGTKEDAVYERFLHDRLPLESWIGANGQVVLIGDGTW